MIYRSCLFVGKIAPYSDSEAKPLLPYVAVLRVCKAIFSEAEPVVYENTFILTHHTAIQKLFDKTLATPARKLMLKSVEISLENKYPIPKDTLLSSMMSMMELFQRIITRDTGNFIFKMRCFSRYLETDITWPLKIEPILENLRLDRIVLDMSCSSCSDSCTCDIAAISIMCFNSGFALRAPKSVEIKGWDAGGEEAETMVRDCLGVWTSKRMMGYPSSARCTKSDAEKWLLEKGASELIEMCW